MTADVVEDPVDLPCHRCGYDLRAHPHDGICPECEAPVAEAIQFAAIPLRPAWRDSDTRWRRRLLAGVWILVLLPLMDTLRAFDWASRVPVPTVLGSHDPVRTLDGTFAYWPGVFNPLIFCMGVVLLFAKERGRRRNPMDWTRRWGVLGSYVTLLLSAAPVLYISALVVVGISALFIAMPLKYQPGVTDWFALVSSTYLRYGPQLKDGAVVTLVACSSITMVLACVPLFVALRSTGPKHLPAFLLGALPCFSLIHLAQAGQYCFAFSTMNSAELFSYGVYFRPEFVLTRLADGSADLTTLPIPVAIGFVVEITKWCVVLTIALWLTAAQLAVRRRDKKATAA